MSSSSSTTPAEESRRKRPRRAKTGLSQNQLSLNPKSAVPLGRKQVAAALLGIWVLLIVFGVVAIGEPDWLKGISTSGKDTEVRTILEYANLRFQNKQFQDAIRIYQKVLKIDPINISALANTAMALGATQREEQGILLLRNNLHNDKQQPEVLYYNLGMLLERAGKPLEALTAYQSAFGGTMEPHLVEARRGFCYLALDNAVQAEEAFLAALSILENPASAYKDMCRRIDSPSDSLANALIQAYQKDESRYDIPLVAHTLRYHPQRSSMHKILGQLLKTQNRNEDALLHYEQALDASPNNRELLAEIAALK